MDESITFKLGRNRKFKKTQRTLLRLSKAGVGQADFANEAKGLYNVCLALSALVDEPNFTMSIEDIAVAIEGREDEAIDVITACFAAEEEPEDAKKISDPMPDGSASSLASPRKSTGKARPKP